MSNPVDNSFLLQCAQATDFELCNAIASAVENKYGYESCESDSGKIPICERIPLILWSAQGFAEKEGLVRMLELAFDRPAWADCYDIIDLPHIAQPLRKLVCALPDVYEECPEAGKILSSKGMNWGAVESLILENSKQVVEGLARFIRQHIQSFCDLSIEWAERRNEELGNIGFLQSAYIWIRTFAHDNQNRVPTSAELAGIVSHQGLKDALASEIEVVPEVNLSTKQVGEKLALLSRPVMGKKFCVTVAGEVQEYP